MRKLFDQLAGSLRQFVKQRDHLLLLVPCADSDVPLLLKALRDLDRESASDLFLLFGDNFRASAAFLDDIAQRLQEELDVTNAAVETSLPKLPPLPSDFLDPRCAPSARLEAALRYGQSLIDARRGQRFVWAMSPGTIDDAESYVELLSRLPPKSQIRPWMRGARIVARVPVDFQLESTPLAGSKRVRVEPFTIPPHAHEEELLATAEDPKALLGDRMQAEVQLAYLDYAHGRFELAIRRFLKSLAFFQWAEIPVMEALIISGLGDIARQQKDWREAQHWYACAVVPAAKGGHPILMATIVQNLAAIAYQEGRFDDAEDRYAELVILKRAMIDEDGLVEALAWQGLSQEKQRGYERALPNWQEAALICKSFSLDHRLDGVLHHLKRGYQALDMREELAAFDAEWRS